MVNWKRRFWVLILIAVVGLYYYESKISNLEDSKEDVNQILDKKIDKISYLQSEVNSLKSKRQALNQRLNNEEEIFQKYKNWHLQSLEEQGYSGEVIIRDTRNKTRIVGHMEYGQKTGKWIDYDYYGNSSCIIWEYVRVGAKCCDGSRSSSTGRGTCSWHGGVCTWLHDYRAYYCY